MDKEILQKMFCNKINTEIEVFKYRMKKRTPEQIISKAYKITCMLDIYEDMVMMSRELDAEALRRLLAIPKLLDFLFDKWMHVEDSFLEDLHRCNREYLTTIGIITEKESEVIKYEEAGIDEGN